MHYLEVPKLSGKPKKEIEKWLYFIGHGDKEDETVRVLLSKDRMMEEAKRRYEYFVADERARIAYQQREKFLRDQANYIHTAKMEGLEEGAKQKALETARKLKDMGMTAEQIQEATGLEEPELGRLFS
jgi:predicted transposase/invertase (TIGR01784 family)